MQGPKYSEESSPQRKREESCVNSSFCAIIFDIVVVWVNIESNGKRQCLWWLCRMEMILVVRISWTCDVRSFLNQIWEGSTNSKTYLCRARKRFDNLSHVVVDTKMLLQPEPDQWQTVKSSPQIRTKISDGPSQMRQQRHERVFVFFISRLCLGVSVLYSHQYQYKQVLDTSLGKQ